MLIKGLRIKVYCILPLFLLLLLLLPGKDILLSAEPGPESVDNLEKLTKAEIFEKLIEGLKEPFSPSIKGAKLEASDLIEAALQARKEKEIEVDLYVANTYVVGPLNLRPLAVEREVSKEVARNVQKLSVGQQILYIPNGIRIKNSRISSVLCARPTKEKLSKNGSYDSYLEERKVLFGDNLEFNGSVVNGTVRLNNIIVEPKHSYFHDTLFQRKVVFDRSQFIRKKDTENTIYQFSSVSFEEGASFADVIFSSSVEFTNVKFGLPQEFSHMKKQDKASAYFVDAIFEDDVNFYGDIYFQGANFQNTKFEGNVTYFPLRIQVHKQSSKRSKQIADPRIVFQGLIKYTGAEFKETTLFQNVNFRKQSYANFSGVTFQGPVHFRNTKFRGNVRFLATSFKDSVSLIGTSFSNPQEAVKPWSAALGSISRKSPNYRKIINYHYKKYMRAKRAQKSWFNPIRWFELVAIDWTCAYGTSWVSVLVSWFFIILAFTGVFYISPGVRNESGEPIDTRVKSFYFVITTFTTLGYGDYKPRNKTSKILTAILALSGSFLFALFIWVLARQFFL